MKAYIVSVLLCAAASLFPLTKSDITTFSDREEKKSSHTVIHAVLEDDLITATYAIPEHVELGYAYAGVAVKMESAGVHSLFFTMKRSANALQPASVTLRTKAGKRAKIDFSKLGSVTGEWQTFAVSLDDFILSDSERDIDSVRFSLGVNSVKDDVSEAAGTVWIKDIALSDARTQSRSMVPEYGFLRDRKTAPVKRGHAAWIYEESDAHVARIRAWNKVSSVPIRILFVYAGSFTFTPEGGRLSALRTQRLAWFREHLPAEVEVHANFDASAGKRLGTYPAEKQEALANLAADAVNADPSCAGIHFDIEPYVSEALPFYIAVKKYSTKPVSAAVAVWDRHLFAVLDYAVLMAYDIARSPDQFANAARARYETFAADAVAAGTTYFLGVPFVSTAMEYEYRENLKTGAREPSGYTMESFTRAAGDAYCTMKRPKSDTFYCGSAIWGFLSGEYPRKDWVNRPREITEPCWKYLSDF
ncbi:MAG: hypothetical protein AABZ39_00465 [Spirochaetota bacterium]